MSICHQCGVRCAGGYVIQLGKRSLIVIAEDCSDLSDIGDYVSHTGLVVQEPVPAVGKRLCSSRRRGFAVVIYFRSMKNPLAVVTDRLSPKRKEQIEKAAKITAGTAAAIWVVLQLRRELYGPGGSKMSRYDRAVDKVWNRD